MTEPVKYDEELRQHITAQLCAAGNENPLNEARWLLELAARKRLDAAQLSAWVKRRCAGEPFQYIVGSVEFYSIELMVGPGVLIPRPETELLVDLAIEALREAPDGSRVLDLCTGSGAIPLALSHECPQYSYTGVDISPEALKWAQLNREALRPRDCAFLQGDLFAPIPPQSRFVLITANPPYVSSQEYSELDREVKDYEPRLALEAADDGLALEKAIAEQARDFLAPSGTLLLEIGDTQGARMAACLHALGYTAVAIHQDLAGKDRIASARLA